MIKKPLVSGSSDDLIEQYWNGSIEKKKNNPTEEFKKYCKDLPWMAECKQYDV